MLRHLGAVGVLGLLLLLGGIGVIAWRDPVIAAGIALAIAGLGLVVRALVSSLMGALGMGGMV